MKPTWSLVPVLASESLRSGEARLMRALPSWALSGTTGIAAVSRVSSGDGLAFGVEGGGVADGDDFASGSGPGVDLAEGFEGDAIGGGRTRIWWVPRPTLSMASASMKSKL